MECYNCGCRLSEKDFCTNCGADVGTYKKIICFSNYFYNDGLEKANVRDLSGAINSLRQSLKFNKNHIDARNLLGLIYFEMGETVAALSEWVISKNIQSKKNIADDYISMIQENPGRLETINATIKKYNLALQYCWNDSLDLAVIQLKKVLSLNPKFIQAHQLLALLYIHSEEWERARRELVKCSRIDTNNTITLRYMKEVTKMMHPEEETGNRSKKKNTGSDDIITYQSGNETIIQPLNPKDPPGMHAVLNIMIGVVVGIAVAWFLVLPARIQSANAASMDEMKQVSEELANKTAENATLQQQVNELTANQTSLEEQLTSFEGADGMLEANENLIQASNIYLNTENEEERNTRVAEYLKRIDSEFLTDGASENFVTLYTNLLASVGPEVAQSYYDTGYEALQDEDYETAITNFRQAFEFDATNSEALYNLALSYYQNGNYDLAEETFTRVTESFTGSELARKAESYLSELADM